MSLSKLQQPYKTALLYSLKWILALALVQSNIRIVNPARSVGRFVAFPTGKAAVSKLSQRFTRLRPTSSLMCAIWFLNQHVWLIQNCVNSFIFFLDMRFHYCFYEVVSAFGVLPLSKPCRVAKRLKCALGKFPKNSPQTLFGYHRPPKNLVFHLDGGFFLARWCSAGLSDLHDHLSQCSECMLFFNHFRIPPVFCCLASYY